MRIRSTKLLAETVEFQYIEIGEGRPHLLLHPDKGPMFMCKLFAVLASNDRVILPLSPPLNNNYLSDWPGALSGLTALHVAFVEKLDLTDVPFIGNDVGGWIAAELAVLAAPSITSLLLLNAIGLPPFTEGRRMVNFTMPIKQDLGEFVVAQRRFDENINRLEYKKLTETICMATLHPSVYDLTSLLRQLQIDTLILWGENDIVTITAYGCQFAALIPGAIFKIVPLAGHYPQFEQPKNGGQPIQSFLSGC